MDKACDLLPPKIFMSRKWYFYCTIAFGFNFNTVHPQNMGFAAPSMTMTPHHKEEKLHKKNINQPQLIFVRKKRESREGREKKKRREGRRR
jgi:hypothetical protein